MLWPNWVCFDRKLEIKSVVKTIVMNVMPDLILDIVPNMPHIYIYTRIHTYIHMSNTLPRIDRKIKVLLCRKDSAGS